jgi:anthranilate synthase component 2
MARFLVIDNYDSFTYNLVQMFIQYDLTIKVVRSDKITLDQVDFYQPDYILISPGPKDPQNAGISIPLIAHCMTKIPIMGVCLGMQAINEVFGGQTVRCDPPVHGKTSRIHHQGEGVFEGIPSPFTAARYHSLMVAPDPAALASELCISARTSDGVIMGLAHRSYPLWGVQFHPESFLTEYGFAMVENFLRLGPMQKSLSAMPAYFISKFMNSQGIDTAKSNATSMDSIH